MRNRRRLIVADGYLPLVDHTDIAALQAGDVLSKYYHGGLTHNVIAGGQKFWHPTKKYANIVHTALYIGDGWVAEASSGGLHKNSLTQHLAKSYKYKAYRFVGERANGLIEAVLQRVETHMGRETEYSQKNAFFSNMAFGKQSVREAEKVPLIDGSQVFCSGTVVDWFNNTALELNLSPPIGFDGSAASPQALEGFLDKSSNWRFIAKVKRG
jgi:hypothetical protein